MQIHGWEINDVIPKTDFTDYQDFRNTNSLRGKQLHIDELKVALEKLKIFGQKVNNCGNCNFCETCQACQKCQACQTCQGCQDCQQCQSCQRSYSCGYSSSCGCGGN